MAIQPYTQDPAAEQQALADALSAPSQGGAATGIPAGSDVPAILDADPGTRQLLQEQVYSRAYGEANPQFVQPGASTAGAGGGGNTGTPVTTQPINPGDEVGQGLIDRINAAYPDINNMTQDQLAAAEMERIQNQIDAINAMYNVRIAEENRKGEGRLGGTRSVNALGGTLYDPFGQARIGETEAYNREVVGKIQAERANLIASLTSEAAARAQGQFQENARLAMQRADSYVGAITQAYQLSQQEAQALRQEALQRAQMTGEIDGDPTLSFRQYLLDVTNSLEANKRADEQLELQRQEFERAGYQTQVMPNGQLVAVDSRTYPPTYKVIGTFARPTGGGSGSSGSGYDTTPNFDPETGTYYYAPKDPTSGLQPIRLTAGGAPDSGGDLADSY